VCRAEIESVRGSGTVTGPGSQGSDTRTLRLFALKVLKRRRKATYALSEQT